MNRCGKCVETALSLTSLSDLELLRSASIFVENLFHTLVKAECTKCYSLPDYLASGLRQLSFRSSIGQTVSDLRDTDTAAALCMVLYFSCLNEQQMFSPTQIGQILWQLHEKGLLLQCTPQRPLTAKFLLYLLAFADSSEEGDNLSPVLQNAESNLVQLAVSEQSVEHWATPHPHVFLWVFATLHRAQHLGASLLEHWLLHTKGRIQTAGQDGGDTGGSHVVCTLFLNPHFRLVLFSLMTSSSEEISVLSGKLFVTLITSNTGRSDEQSHQLARLLYGEVMSQFQSLFVLSVQPLRHVVNSFLQTLVAVLQHPMCEPSEADLNKQIGVVYHLVHHIGTSDSEDSELLYNGMISLDCLSKTTDEEQDRTVVPILLQNAKFMQQLERCLFRDEQLISSVALSIVAWISSSSSSCQTDQPITLDAEFILRIIMRSANKQAVAALKILYLSLSQSSLDLNSPLSFHSSHTFHQAGSLYSLQELRLLFTYVQQYVCLEDKEIQFCAVKCYLEILNHSKLFDSAQGDGLLHHPWTPHLLHFVLTNTASSGLELHTAEFIHQIWCHEANSGQAEVAKLVLESVLVTEISAENQDLLQLLVQKAKTDCPEDDLWEQAALKLSAFDTCLSSQNTLLST
ncbi:uncharacterized protein LOC143274576 isoform X2 [Babylonia areolata]|uniref:uncharacterized protein LOC143274576 isoform X2 n=2 Tax=Babylonia areolata TaxID=304850 RepID=UPI003FD61056